MYLLNIKLLLFTSIIIDICFCHLKALNDVDFVVIGAGTAGCIVAARLVEKGYNVVVLEAGKQPPPKTDTARIYIDLIKTDIDWQFYTEPQKDALLGHPNRTTLVSAGKMYGGSGSLNVMLFLRGAKHDYDKWEEMGAKGWNYRTILPYIKKLEKSYLTNVDQNDHGQNGKIPVTNNESQGVPMMKSFVNAVNNTGYEFGDPNDGSGNKVGYMQFNFYNGKRQSTWNTYLKPMVGNEHLTIVPDVILNKIIFDKNKKAIGVNFDKNNITNITVNVKREVIVCAGAINTPQVLMLSGIGPKKELEKHQIKVLSNRPVGKNLIDHMGISFLAFENVKNETRPMSAATAFIKSDDSQPHSDIQFFHFTADKYVVAFTLLLGAESRGEIRLRSTDPKEKVILDPKYLSVKNDLKRFAKGLRKHVELLEKMNLSDTDYKKITFRKITNPAAEIMPQNCKEHDSKTDVFWECVVQYIGDRAVHMVGSAKMGEANNNGSVVDPELRVIGVSGVRVADASVMPTIVSANPQVAVMAIAEKAADLIINDHNDQLIHRKSPRRLFSKYN